MVERVFGTKQSPLAFPVLLASVYFAEGLVSAMFGLSFLYLTQVGIDGSRLGVIIFIALVPLFFKPVTGFICDSFSPIGFGRRKDWLIVGLVGQACGFGILALWTEGEALWMYLAGMIIVVSALIFYDACIDGYAIEKTNKEEFGRVQSWMTSGRYFSILITPVVATYVAANIGWSTTFIMMAVLSLLPLALIGLADDGHRGQSRYFVPKIREIVSLRNVLICAAGFGAMLGTSGTEEVYLGYFRDQVGVPLEVVGSFGTIFGIGVIVGAIATPSVSEKLDLGLHTQNVLAFFGVIAVTIVMISSTSAGLAVASALLFGIVMGVIHVTVFAYGMHVAVEGGEATGFSIFSFFLVSGTVLAMSAAPSLVEFFGYRMAIGLSVIGAIIGLLSIALLSRFEPDSAKQSQE